MHTSMVRTTLRNGDGKEYAIEQLSSGYACEFSGVSVANAAVRIDKSRRFPLLIRNSTNQTPTLKRGCPIARFSKVGSITEITMPDKQKNRISNEELEQVNEPEELK